MKTLRNKIAFILIIGTLIMLYPGLTRPIMTISMENQLAALIQSPMAKELIRKNPELIVLEGILNKMAEQSSFTVTRNIMQSINDLWQNKLYVVAGLIILFSVVVPLIKALGLLLILLFPGMQKAKGVHLFISVISKWAMAEVFVVAVLIAYFAVATTGAIEARLEPGFYWFLAYCILSIAASQLVKPESNRLSPETL